MKLKNIAYAVSLVALTACGNDSKPQNPEMLKGKDYAATMNGQNVTLSFDPTDMRAYGGIVNRYNGSYTADAEKIAFGPIASTMMMGPADAMQVERDYFNFMSATDKYDISGSVLTITDKNGQEIVFTEVVTPVADDAAAMTN